MISNVPLTLHSLGIERVKMGGYWWEIDCGNESALVQ